MIAGRQKILVIKLGALGDFIQALGPCAAIRAHHTDAEITLLTTAPFVEFAGMSGYFNRVVVDTRPSVANMRAILRLRRSLNDDGFSRVYDLQTADRTNFYYRLLRKPKPEWSGIAPGCSHPHANPDRDHMHTIDRQREQLQMAGIDNVPATDLSWLQGDIGRFNVPSDYMLFFPGGSAHRPAKRWPAENYAELADLLGAKGVTPVLLGGGADQAAIDGIKGRTTAVLDLSNQTSLTEIALLAKGAKGAVGSDSGPMHLIATAGCPSLVLFSAASDPALCAPRGENVGILRRDPLSALSVNEVEAELRLR